MDKFYSFKKAFELTFKAYMKSDKNNISGDRYKLPFWQYIKITSIITIIILIKT